MDDILKLDMETSTAKHYSVCGDDGIEERLGFSELYSAVTWLNVSTEIAYLLRARELVKEPTPRKIAAGMYIIGRINNNGTLEYCYAPIEEEDVMGLNVNGTSYIYVFESPATATKVCEYMDMVMEEYLECHDD